MKNTYTESPVSPKEKEAKTMSEEKKFPTHKAFSVENFNGKTGEGKAAWTEIGAAWQHKDGKGFDIVLKALPLNGRVVLREATRDKV